MKLPTSGSVFAMPLTDGRWGACRVLRASAGSGAVIAEATSWIGDAPPTLADLTPFQPDVLSHHSWKSRINRLNVIGKPPSTFRLIGVQRLTPKETAVTSDAWSGWENLAFHVLLQWRWVHEREKVLAEDAEKAAADARAREVFLAKEKTRGLTLTLAKVRTAKPFASWKGHVKPAIVKESRALLVRCVDELVALGPQARKATKIAVFKKCIEGFNDLDTTHDRWIMTIEREDICEAFQDVVAAAGLIEEALADRWRDW